MYSNYTCFIRNNSRWWFFQKYYTIVGMTTTPLSGIRDHLLAICTDLNIPVQGEQIKFEHPADTSHGDYATTFALSTFALYKSDHDFLKQFASPRAFAEHCVLHIKMRAEHETTNFVADISVAGPGFINIFLSSSALIEEAHRYLQGKPIGDSKTSQHCLIESVSPNTNKPLHIGHLRNAALGIALAHLFEKNGWQVTRAIEYNDRGLHIMKSVWGYLVFGMKNTVSESMKTKDWKSQLTSWQENSSAWLTPGESADERLQKSDHFVGHWYQKADLFAEDAGVTQAWGEMLRSWEDEHDSQHLGIRLIWQCMNNWFYEGYQQTAARFGFSFDKDAVSYESSIYTAGKDIIVQEAENGTFEKLADGAVVARLDKFKLPDKVLLRKDGTGIYMTFDIELTRQRSTKKADKMIWVVGMDQKLYFQQLFAVAELLNYGNRDAFFHFAYGMVRLPEGKMSSRKGMVIYGDDLLNASKAQAKQVLSNALVAKSTTDVELEEIVEKIGVGAVKWTMLSQDPQSEITFDIAESVSIKGFAGPYVQYTFARTHSILQEAKNAAITIDFDILRDLLISSKISLAKEEIDVLRYVYIYSEIIGRAMQEYAPHILCQYLFTLAQRYNSLYAELPILSATEHEKLSRLFTTQVVGAILKDGLEILGIATPERM